MHIMQALALELELVSSTKQDNVLLETYMLETACKLVWHMF